MRMDVGPNFLLSRSRRIHRAFLGEEERGVVASTPSTPSTSANDSGTSTVHNALKPEINAEGVVIRTSKFLSLPLQMHLYNVLFFAVRSFKIWNRNIYTSSKSSVLKHSITSHFRTVLKKKRNHRTAIFSTCWSSQNTREEKPRGDWEVRRGFYARGEPMSKPLSERSLLGTHVPPASCV